MIRYRNWVLNEFNVVDLQPISKSILVLTAKMKSDLIGASVSSRFDAIPERNWDWIWFKLDEMEEQSDIRSSRSPVALKCNQSGFGIIAIIRQSHRSISDWFSNDCYKRRAYMVLLYLSTNKDTWRRRHRRHSVTNQLQRCSFRIFPVGDSLFAWSSVPVCLTFASSFGHLTHFCCIVYFCCNYSRANYQRAERNDPQCVWNQ